MQGCRVLVVDDDAVTLRFFAAALRVIGADMVSVEDGASARTAVDNDTFDLLLIDRHLPDTTGERLLRSLRDAGCTTPAIATSADVDDEIRANMLDAAFDDVIAKPISVERLREIVNRFITVPTQLLRDDDALQVLGGHRGSLIALRGLLADELDEVRASCADFDTLDRNVLSARLHRLRASCGFCGADALAHAAAKTQTLLDENAAVDWLAFLALCAATATALRAPTTT
ncbi:MAG TPA: response regulator [Rudaea sp.]|jgi:DNA-binding response OmpR family regulator|nr:response regulator [Rudaea sp.]